ncbi:hypothetical protein [Streptomyces sp. BE230]|uniref:hypothetical protein n=1 Tax=Streptomyces sp. BE230 TaxID=3002526 RepID=UPI002ED337AF|nr:hypothetical protein [Streptomyces sp. BE230]
MTTSEIEPEIDDTEEAPRGVLAAWLWPGEWREAVARWVIATIALAVATTALVLHPWLLWTIAAAALAIALAAAHRRRTDQTNGQEPDEEDEEQPPVPDPADMADIVRELGTGTGVLLTTLRDQLLEEYPGQGWTTKRVRPLLAEAGIRVRDGVRVPGVGNDRGVHRDDVPAPLPSTTPPPPVGVVAAGQNANTNTNNVRVTRHAEGAQITVTPASVTTQKT